MTFKAMAHRGYPGRLPENTLGSFQAAIDCSFSYLELDVHLSKDGIPVVMHDYTVDRMTDGSGLIKDYTYDELRRLRIAGGETIPTLEEALLLAKGRIIVEIELKQAGGQYDGLEEAVLDVISRHSLYDQVFVASFDHYAVARMRELSDKVALGIINSSASPAFFPWMKSLHVTYLSVGHPFITGGFVQECMEHGVQLIAWTIDDEATMRRFCADYPDVLVCTNELGRWIDVKRSS